MNAYVYIYVQSIGRQMFVSDNSLKSSSHMYINDRVILNDIHICLQYRLLELFNRPPTSPTASFQGKGNYEIQWKISLAG